MKGDCKVLTAISDSKQYYLGPIFSTVQFTKLNETGIASSLRDLILMLLPAYKYYQSNTVPSAATSLNRTYSAICLSVYYRVAPNSKPPPNDKKIVLIVLKLRYLVIYITDYSRISLTSEMLVIGLKAHSHYHNSYV